MLCLKDKDKNILIMCVSQQILINTTVEHRLQNPQASNVLMLHSAHLQYLRVLILTLPRHASIWFPLSLVRKLSNLTEGNYFNERRTQLVLNSPNCWHVSTDRWVFSSMNQFWFFSFFSCKIGMWTFLPYSIRMSYRY